MVNLVLISIQWIKESGENVEEKKSLYCTVKIFTPYI